MKRFWSKVKKGPGCWEWRGARISTGYGTFRYQGKTAKAHRISLVLAGIELDSELEVHHLCHNRSCVNPQHLVQVTRTENVRESNSPGGMNHRKTHCPRGHEYSSTNTLNYPSDKGRRCKECRHARVRGRQV